MEHYIYRKSHKKLDVNEIKRNLLSRKIENKISAAKRLYRFLMKNHLEESRVLLINADLIEMLCEASCTTNIVLLKYVFRCISVFIEYNQFFQQNHTTYTMVSVIRALYILLKIQGPDNELILGLELVSDIISRLNRQNTAVNTVCNIPNIINLLSKVLNSKSSKLNVYAGTEVIISLLHSQGIHKFKKIMEEIVFELLKVLIEIFKKCNDKKCMRILSMLVNGSMRFLVYPIVEATAESSKSSLFLELVSVMKTILVPFLMESEDKLLENDLEMVKIVLSALLSIYHSPEEPATKEFSHFLASKGFFDILPLLEKKENVMDLVIVIRSLLFELLQCLSNSVLGKEDWRNILLPGFQTLPNGSSFISTILFQQSNHVLPITSITYCYFYLLSSSNPTITEEYYLSLSDYILSLTHTPSASVTKALWFVSAVAYLEKREESHNLNMALHRILNFIMYYNIEEVYTHHPAILYWAFSDKFVSNELQAQIIRQWLDNDDDGAIEDLKLLLTANKESCLVMMGLMASDKKSSLVIYEMLTSIILNKIGEADYISYYAWMTLPHYLAKFSSDSDASKYECLTNVMKFCYISKLKNSNISKILRISCLLPGAFLKYFKMSFSPNDDGKLTVDDNHSGILQSTFNLIDNLIKISLKFNDKRVPAIYITNDTFLNTMELLLTSNSDITNASLMKLLKSFMKFQKLTNQKSSKIIFLDVTRLLQFLCGQPALCTATIKFLALYFEIALDKTASSLIDISLQEEIKVRALYVHIQMICSKSDCETSSYCWICLKKLLELSDGLGLEKHLSGIPYTSKLLLTSVDTGSWKEAVSFIEVWFPNLSTIHTSRALAVPSSITFLTNFIEKLKKISADPKIINGLSKLINYSTIHKEKEEKIKEEKIKEEKIKEEKIKEEKIEVMRK
ncbi:uncharacterized protein [Halyomorpha halys]|uniref:uncharacterized protein n=1 Tax=Halyomorpha halys TaxID=286706 RepID=UPI0034D35957